MKDDRARCLDRAERRKRRVACAGDVTVVELNDREYSDEPSLRQTLLALSETTPEIPVILDIDGSVPLGDVVRVYDACQSAQFRQVSFATKLGRSSP